MTDSSSPPEGGNRFDAEDFQRKAGGCCFKCEGPCQLLLGATVSSRRKRQAAILTAAKAGPPRPEPEVKEKQRNAVVVKPSERPILVQKDHSFDYPELGLEVFVTELGSEIMMAEMFARSHCKQAKSLDQADLVVFTGGPDVDPKLYNETPHKETRYNKDRDKRDLIYYAEALKNRVPMLGVCRGAQFLHVMQGGKLYQHIDGHKGDHGLLDKSKIYTQRHIDRIPSTHHQAVIQHDGMEVLAVIHKSTERWNNNKICERSRAEDIEAFFYRKNCILGIQGHPEYRGYARYTHYCMKLIEERIVGCPDINLEAGKYRVKKEIVILDRA